MEKLLLLVCFVSVSSSNLCSDFNIQLVGRVVFGDARGESTNDQLEIAYTVVNRVDHSAFPNTLNGVVYQKYGSRYRYNTLDLLSHDKEWASAKASNTTAYQNVIKAAKDALCGYKSDQMSCGPVFYCSNDPCSATSDNKWHPVTEKKKIGNHWFACIQ